MEIPVETAGNHFQHLGEIWQIFVEGMPLPFRSLIFHLIAEMLVDLDSLCHYRENSRLK